MIRVTGGKKLARTINFFKKRENWNEIVWVAMNNVADEIRDDAEKKLYEKWKKNTGKTGKSIQPSIYRRGNYTYIGLTSDHPAMNFLEYGGEVKKVPAYTRDHGTRLIPYVKKWAGGASEMFGNEDKAMKMAGSIYDNQPFTEGTFHMTRSLREGLPDLESEIMRTAHRMKP